MFFFLYSEIESSSFQFSIVLKTAKFVKTICRIRTKIISQRDCEILKIYNKSIGLSPNVNFRTLSAFCCIQILQYYLPVNK